LRRRKKSSESASLHRSLPSLVPMSIPQRRTLLRNPLKTCRKEFRELCRSFPLPGAYSFYELQFRPSSRRVHVHSLRCRKYRRSCPSLNLSGMCPVQSVRYVPGPYPYHSAPPMPFCETVKL
jgi:hypothetical protein